MEPGKIIPIMWPGLKGQGVLVRILIIIMVRDMEMIVGVMEVAILVVAIPMVAVVVVAVVVVTIKCICFN
jgi:hypothetical protein